MCLTGRQDVEVFHLPKEEAIVGQDVALPCHLKNSTGLHIESIVWSRHGHDNTNLVVYNSGFGYKLYQPNVTIQILNGSTGSILNILGVTKRNSGIYICTLTLFPSGSIRRQTELMIRGKKKANAHVYTDTPQPDAAVFTGFNIWMRRRNSLIVHCIYLMLPLIASELCSPASLISYLPQSKCMK